MRKSDMGKRRIPWFVTVLWEMYLIPVLFMALYATHVVAVYYERRFLILIPALIWCLYKAVQRPARVLRFCLYQLAKPEGDQ